MLYSRRRRRARRRRIVFGGVVVIAAAAGWWYWPPGAAEVEPGQGAGVVANEPPPAKTITAKPSGPPVEVVRPVADEQVLIPADAALTSDVPTSQRASDETRAGNADIEHARQLYRAGKLIEARQRLNRLLGRRLSEAEQTEVRAFLTRIANETIFSGRRIANDPLLDSYTVQPGDRLINIGQQFEVPHEILMTMNGIRDATKIRAEQRLTVPRGPFHAKIHRSAFRLDVYLQDVYVRSLRVGLGTNNGTPLGIWRVKERLPNPTYYPPASATDKRIIPPDDPNNPLGEHWIGLEGIEGDAVGQEGYGIHGTIEPDSVGESVSLGCVRMLNADVAFLYQLLLPGRSTVTVLP